MTGLALLLGLTAAAAPARQLTVGTNPAQLLGPQHFCANVEYFRPGLDHGTLPADAPGSTREAFVAALRQSGILALRFPGGNAAYHHLQNHQQASLELAHATGHWEYRLEAPPNDRFVSTDQLLKFSAETGIGIIYELPMLFVYDDGAPRAAVPSRFSERAGNYDHDRIEAVAATAGWIVQRAQELGAHILAWELGNEEFAHMQVADYLKVAKAVVHAVRQQDRTTPLIPVAMQWSAEVLPELLELPEFAPYGGAGVHYPFGNWPGPGGDDPNDFVLTDYRIDKWFAAFAKKSGELGYPSTLAVTETTLHRHQQWTPTRIVPTMAHLLSAAWNECYLLGSPDCSCVVFHDLETPFFGLLPYDVWLNPATRTLAWCAAKPPPADLLPENLFSGRYLPTPTARGFGLLASLSGHRLLDLGIEPVADETFRALAAIGDGATVVVLINRGAQPVDVTFVGVPANGELTSISGEPAAILPGELSETTRPGVGSTFSVPGWSVSRWRSR